MRIQAAPAAVNETDMSDQANGALLAPEIEASDDVVACMGAREFHDFAEEVAVHVTLAMVYAGLEDSHDAVVMGCDCVGAEEVDQDRVERVVHFRDEEDCDLPVYVSVGIDGYVFVGVMDDDQNVSIVSPPRTLAESDELVRDIVAAIEREVPRQTRH